MGISVLAQLVERLDTQMLSVEVNLSVTFGADVGTGCVRNTRIQL